VLPSSFGLTPPHGTRGQSKEGYAAIGGGSPLRRITDDQAAALTAALGERGTDARVYVAMRYWRPFTEDAVKFIKEDGCVRPVAPPFAVWWSALNLAPHTLGVHSRATRASFSLRGAQNYTTRRLAAVPPVQHLNLRLVAAAA
jgi:protoheme ferro-lyase